MKKIVFENMPETYEDGNLIFFKEPFKVNGVAWGMVHKGCKSVVLGGFTKGSLMINVTVYAKSPDANKELIDYFYSLEERDNYMIFSPSSGGGLIEGYDD